MAFEVNGIRSGSTSPLSVSITWSTLCSSPPNESAVGDAGAARRGEEPVERRLAGIDERPAGAGRRVRDDERAGVDPEPVVAAAHRRGHGDAGEMRRDGGAELVEPVPVAERGVGQLVLLRLPGERLVGVELEGAKGILRSPARIAARQRSSLFDSWSNHIPNRVNCVPEIRSSATSTIVAVVISLSKKMREQATTRPSSSPSTVISVPRT